MIYFISDLHLGHKLVSEKRGFASIKEHDQFIFDTWNDTIKNDIVWVLGDVAFQRPNLLKMSKLPGSKKLVMGNHDKFGMDAYLKVFDKVYGALRFDRDFWLTHIPVHVGQLNRAKYNIHGHTHAHSLGFPYFNVCCEVVNFTPVPFEDIKKVLKETEEKCK